MVMVANGWLRARTGILYCSVVDDDDDDSDDDDNDRNNDDSMMLMMVMVTVTWTMMMMMMIINDYKHDVRNYSTDEIDIEDGSDFKKH